MISLLILLGVAFAWALGYDFKEGWNDFEIYLIVLVGRIRRLLRRQTQVEKELEALATKLYPSKEYLSEGTNALNSVLDLLVNHSNEYGIKIDRHRIVGSIGKGTAISYTDATGRDHEPDFDCVIFINDLEPPFGHVIQSIAAIIKSDPCVKRISKRKISVGFTYESEEGCRFKIDLLPAPNLVKQTDDEVLQGGDIGELGAEMATKILSREIEDLRSEPKKIHQANRLWSCSFAEQTLSYISREMKDARVLNLVRLAKLWNSHLEIGDYVPARSYMMEVIAIYAHQQNGDKWNVVSGFRQFLELMSKFSMQNITIRIDGPINPPELEQWSANPLIADPVNPFNNLAGGINTIALRTFEIQARNTLEVLDKCVKLEKAGHLNENAIDEIFSHKKSKRRLDKIDPCPQFVKIIFAVFVCYIAILIYDKSTKV